MFSYFVVAIGGAVGSVSRFWLSGAVAEKVGETFPAGTLLVNTLERVQVVEYRHAERKE